VPVLHRAAELLRHRLLAVADAEHGDAEVEDLLRARGVWDSVTEAGPPERITAFGAKLTILSDAALNGQISQ
jgi:hypothetical protein